MTGSVSYRDTDAAVGHLDEIVVVAADLGRRAHLADDLYVVERNVARRQHRELELAGEGQLFGFAAMINFYLLQASGLGDHLFDQPGVFNSERGWSADTH